MKIVAAPQWPSRCVWLILSLAALTLSGCRSLDQPVSASFASVAIANRSVDEIRTATTAVFAEAGYQNFSLSGDTLVFEKEGTRKNQIAHGGWIQDSPVRERVRAEIVFFNDSTHRLQCRAYMVLDAGSRIEEEKRLADFRSGPYQKLLNQVAARLK